VASHWIPGWLHVTLVALGFAVNAAAVPVEVRVCRENVELLVKVEALMGK
jgi:hypothetical protein